jgi:hypothetical protein
MTKDKLPQKVKRDIKNRKIRVGRRERRFYVGLKETNKYKHVEH